MLRISTKSSAAGAKSYYRDGLARGDYYLADSPAAAIWGGKAAQLLGLSGPVSQAAFYQLCENLKPDGTPLTVRTRANRRVGYDINLNCPKSVSLVHAFGGDDRVAPAVREAVEATMKLIEADAQARVRTSGRSTDRATGNLLWATFIHDTTRPVNGVPDPQLHGHSFVFNVTHDGVEGRFKAAQLGYIHSNAPFYEAYFHTVLAGKMRELGYGIVRTGRFWELDGVPRDLIERFSHRTDEIREAAKRLGITDPKDLGKLGARTRGRKSDAKPWDIVRSAWSARISLADLAALRDARHGESREPLGPDARQVLEHARRECMSRSALVSEKNLLEAALRYGVGHVTLDELRNELPKLGMAVREIRGERHFGDDAKLRDEKEMLDFARETRGTVRSFLDDNVLCPKGSTPAEQSALVHLLKSRDRVAIARLRPATNAEFVRQLEASGYTVTRLNGREGEVPSEEAARGPADNPVWWVEHAQHLGTSKMAELFRTADLGGARVVLAPSPGPVHRESALPLLGSRAGLRSPKRAESDRRKQQQQAAAKELADGRVSSALKTLDEVGEFRRVSQDTFAKDVAAEYINATKNGQTSRVQAGSAEMAQSITDAIRAALKKLKRLGRPRRFQQLQRVIWDEENQANPAKYRKGQVVVFFKSVKGFRIGQRYEVLGLDPWGRHVLARHLAPKKGWLGAPSKSPWVEALPLHRLDAFAVFERSEIELAKGDTIRITMQGKTRSERFGVEKLLPKRTRVKNQKLADALGLKTPDRRYRVKRDSEHGIRGFTAGGHIRLGNGWVLDRDFAHFEHGYCAPVQDDNDGFFRAGADARMEKKGRVGPSWLTIFARNKDAVMNAAQTLEAESATATVTEATPSVARRPARGRSRGVDLGR